MNVHIQVGSLGDGDGNVRNSFSGNATGGLVQVGSANFVHTAGRNNVSSGDGYVLRNDEFWLIPLGSAVWNSNGQTLVNGRPLDPAEARPVPNPGGPVRIVEERGRLVINDVEIADYPLR